ncbi:disintegrin and metalloproteinase domain-containing protein 21-like [Myotis lucifugus]|uniref:disintegrin and metalloproteinase domain-containing protein 21-like n=1 Tax=Myotis lucifugus TaxID=59463 RepID=UPI0003C4D4C9|nr:disintegrin and metalloproteinase domain-containing protein 21-like [Myotis lucifugus]
MRLAGGPVTLRTPLLLLGLWVVLAPTQCSQGRPSWRYISSEVVIPTKELHHSKAVRAAGWLSYSLRFGGQRHVLHMRRKRLFWPGQLTLFTVSIIASNQIGTTFGLWLDTVECVCQRRATCIMYRYPVLTDSFSNCSFQHTAHVLNNNIQLCLFQERGQLVYSNSSLTTIRCGNSVVENGEQCDCGTFKQCYSNTCCESDCRFSPGSICNRETCCTNCTQAPAGTLCRPIQNICDLPEYCMGKDTNCPSDFYLQDGTPCTEDGYCYEGNCTDRSMHCKEIFGEGALSAPDVCYSINKKGHRFGHCKVTIGFAPQRCADADVMCGRLQCVNVTHLPRLQEHVGFHHSIIGESLCFGVGAHRGTESTDVGAVRSGTPCGGGKFCLKGFCNATLAAIDYNCPPSKCNYRGVCNNNRNCHCHVGWDPPLCINSGAGGSVDSGPAPRRRRSVRAGGMSLVYLRVVFGRSLALIAALLFGVAMNVRTIQTTTVTEVKVRGK